MRRFALLALSLVLTFTALLIFAPLSEAMVLPARQSTAAQLNTGGNVFDQIGSLLDNFTKRFDINPFAFWNRAKAAKLGFESVRESIEEKFDEISGILSSYGIEMTRDIVARDEAKIQKAIHDDEEIMEVLEGSSPRRRLRVIAGGEKRK